MVAVSEIIFPSLFRTIEREIEETFKTMRAVERDLAVAQEAEKHFIHVIANSKSPEFIYLFIYLFSDANFILGCIISG